MIKNIFLKLNDKDIYNDMEFVFWIYNIENLIVDNKRYLKIYLFNRNNSTQQLNSITFKYYDRIYTINSFSIVSEYETPKIIGCICEIDISYSKNSVTVISEITDGLKYVQSCNLVKYENPFLIFNINEYLQNEINVFPYICNQFWQCSCGSINNSKELICSNCKLPLSQLSRISHLEWLNNVKIQINKKYDQTINYEKNLKIISEKTNIPEKIISKKFTWELFNKKYKEELKNKEYKLKAKYKKFIKLASYFIVSIVFLISLLFALKLLFPIKYYELALQFGYNQNICSTIDVKTKENRSVYDKCYIYELRNLYDSQKYTEIINLEINSKFPYFEKDSDNKEAQKILNQSKYNQFNLYYTSNEFFKAFTLSETMKFSYLSNEERLIIEEDISNKILEMLKLKVENGEDRYTDYLKQYSENKSSIGYQVFLLSLHNEIVKDCNKYETTLFRDDKIITQYFSSATEFYNELKNSNYSDYANDQCYDRIRLFGNWSNSSYYFSLDSTEYISYNLPFFVYGDYYSIYNHDIYFYKEIIKSDGSISREGNKNLFNINFVSDNLVEFYCYKNGETIILYKNY